MTAADRPRRTAALGMFLMASCGSSNTNLPFPGSGNLCDATGEQGWVVVLQRDGTIRGPMPALRYVPVHYGMPGDVVAYHLMQSAEAMRIYNGWSAAEPDYDVVSTAARRSRPTVLLGIAAVILAAVVVVHVQKRE